MIKSLSIAVHAFVRRVSIELTILNITNLQLYDIKYFY